MEISPPLEKYDQSYTAVLLGSTALASLMLVASRLPSATSSIRVTRQILVQANQLASPPKAAYGRLSGNAADERRMHAM